MNSKLWIRKALSMCSMVAILATSSMVALAGEAKASGELIVNGKDAVIVNGEAAKSGRTIFTSSIISTPETSGATLNLGKAGQVEVAPSTTLTVSFDSSAVDISLSSGSITNVRSAQAMNVTAGGTVQAVNVGESVNTAKAQDDDDEKSGNWLLWGAVFGGAVAAIIFGAMASSDRSLGGGATVVSPVR